jgi:hypothetical protein
MNRFDIVALCAAFLVSVRYVPMMLGVADIYLPHASTLQWASWIAGEIVFTYGPIALAVLCWRWSKGARWPAVPHLLVLPGAILLMHLGASLMLSVTIASDFDDTIGTPVIGGTLLFLIAFATYVAALMNLVIKGSTREETE